MRKNFTAVSLVVAALAIGLILMATGCSKKITETDISYAGPMLDNVLAGIKDKDYKEFSKDFSSKMISAITEDSFKTLADTLETKIGDYQSRTFGGAENTKSAGEDVTVVVYKAKYTKESGDVLITISFSDENGSKKVSGFYLNSPNLRK